MRVVPSQECHVFLHSRKDKYAIYKDYIDYNYFAAWLSIGPGKKSSNKNLHY